jgi:ribonuclease-3
MNLEKLQESIEYNFNDLKLLKQALVHRSYLNERNKVEEINEHNERLEFLGDAVLELVVTDFLYKNIDKNEGLLTSLRASLVNYKTMSSIGNDIGLNEQVLVSKGEKDETGSARVTIVADCIEAVIGAMYLDGGYDSAAEFIEKFVLVKLPDIIKTGSYRDHKTMMQEFCQKHTKITPRYKIIFSEGKDHEKVFRVGVWVGVEKISEGVGKSKQEAETEAAREALDVLQKRFGVDIDGIEMSLGTKTEVE